VGRLAEPGDNLPVISVRTAGWLRRPCARDAAPADMPTTVMQRVQVDCLDSCAMCTGSAPVGAQPGRYANTQRGLTFPWDGPLGSILASVGCRSIELVDRTLVGCCRFVAGRTGDSGGADAVLANVSPVHSENVSFFGAIEAGIDAELAQLGLTAYRPLPVRDTLSAACRRPTSSVAAHAATANPVWLSVAGDGVGVRCLSWPRSCAPWRVTRLPRSAGWWRRDGRGAIETGSPVLDRWPCLLLGE